MAELNQPVFLLISGVGGSGTRLAAKIIAKLGIYMGTNLNGSYDNLDWPGNRRVILDRSKTTDEIFQEISPDYRAFARKMIQDAAMSRKNPGFWGAKIPGGFHFLPYLAQMFDSMRHVHVIRQGLDMAFSSNNNQLFHWGSFHGILPPFDELPRYLLKYWARANQYAVDQGAKLLGDRQLVIRFEDICFDKINIVHRIMSFLDIEQLNDSTLQKAMKWIGVERPDRQLRRITRLIKPPKSIERYKQLGSAEMFDEADIKTVKDFGYAVEWIQD